MQALLRQKVVAKRRRYLENVEFERLSAELPIARAISRLHIDKASIVRLAAAYIQLSEHFSSSTDKNGNIEANAPGNESWNVSLLEVLDGFLVCLSLAGEILYVSETISIHLGLSQVELAGTRIFNYIHEEDIEQFKSSSQLAIQTQGPTAFNLRMRSTLTKRVNRDRFRCNAGYKVINGEMIVQRKTRSQCFIIFCQSLPTSISPNVQLDISSFAISTDMNLTICYIDARGEEIFGNCPANKAKILVGSNFYQHVHYEDADIIKKMHYEVIKLGASKTSLYRLIKNDHSSTIYVETCAIFLGGRNCSSEITLTLRVDE